MNDRLESQISICLISREFGESRKLEGKLEKCMRNERIHIKKYYLPFRLQQCLTRDFGRKTGVRTTGVEGKLERTVAIVGVLVVKFRNPNGTSFDYGTD